MDGILHQLLPCNLPSCFLRLSSIFLCRFLLQTFFFLFIYFSFFIFLFFFLVSYPEHDDGAARASRDPLELGLKQRVDVTHYVQQEREPCGKVNFRFIIGRINSQDQDAVQLSSRLRIPTKTKKIETSKAST
jgi:hypothetical protein